MTLSNDKQIHQVILKLDKDIPRERALRQFLDDSSTNGINRKETILRIFEEYSNSSPFKIKKEPKLEEMITITKEEFERIKTNSNKEDIEIIKANKEVTDVNQFDE